MMNHHLPAAFFYSLLMFLPCKSHKSASIFVNFFGIYTGAFILLLQSQHFESRKIVEFVDLTVSFPPACNSLPASLLT